MPPVRPKGFFCVLTTGRLTECRDFYTRCFGFDVAFEADWYIHLTAENGMQLGFLLPGHPSQPEFLHKSYPGEGVIYTFEVEDVEREFEKLNNGNVPILFPVRTEDWGQKHFMIRDPAGMVVDVVQAVAPTDEYKENYTG